MILLADTSVVLEWLHEEGESEVQAARELLAVHRDGAARLLLLDLAVYGAPRTHIAGHRPAVRWRSTGRSCRGRRSTRDGPDRAARHWIG